MQIYSNDWVKFSERYYLPKSRSILFLLLFLRYMPTTITMHRNVSITKTSGLYKKAKEWTEALVIPLKTAKSVRTTEQ